MKVTTCSDRLMVYMTWLNEMTGSEGWWQEQQQRGIPFVEASETGDCNVTFFGATRKVMNHSHQLSGYGSILPA